jgi:hypothetical protein
MSQYLDQLMKEILGPVGTPQMSPVDTIKPIEGILGAFMDQGPAPQMSPVPEMGVGQVSGGPIQMQVSGGSPAQDMQTMIGGAEGAGGLSEAAMRYQTTQNRRTQGIGGPGGRLLQMGEALWDASREKGAREELARQMGIAQQAEKALKLSEAEALEQAVHSQALQLTGDKDFADSVGKLSQADPAGAQAMLKQAAEQRFATQTDATRNLIEAGYEPGTPEFKAAMDKYMSKSGVTVNLPGSPPKLGQGEVPRNPEAWAAGDYSHGTYNVEEVKKAEGYRQQVVENSSMALQNITDIEREIEEAFLPATGPLGGMVRAVTSFGEESGEAGGVARSGPLSQATSAGRIESYVGALRNRLGLEEINKMRQYSPSGGALGNVSNFEVRVVQAAKRPLDPNMPEEEFLAALSDIKTSFQRQQFLANNYKDLEKVASTQGPEAVQAILNERFPLSDTVMQNLNAMTFDPETHLEVQEDGGGTWSIEEVK